LRKTTATCDPVVPEACTSEPSQDGPIALLAAQFEPFYRIVYGYLLHRLFDRELAEELTAETFYRAAAHPHRIPGDADPLRFWLLRTATNLAHTHDRRKRLGRRVFARLAYTKGVGTAPPADTEPPDAQRLAEVRKALRSLSPKDQTVIVLRHYTSMSCADIAGVLGCRESTARVRLSRATKALRERLGVQGGRPAPPPPERS